MKFPKGKNYFKNIYQVEENSNRYIIEVSLYDYDDVHDPWDPAPFEKRAMNSTFSDFLLGSSDDIPLHYDLGVLLHLPKDKKDEKKERMLDLSYRYYYYYLAERSTRMNTDQKNRAYFYLLMAALFMISGYLITSWPGPAMIASILKEGTLIGGWVFLWEFLSRMFITKRERTHENKLYRRLEKAKIWFSYY